jgi:sterol desaturase/sphingolipid hydroxylase (fatty acid hydroxylase superfamily)
MPGRAIAAFNHPVRKNARLLADDASLTLPTAVDPVRPRYAAAAALLAAVVASVYGTAVVGQLITPARVSDAARPWANPAGSTDYILSSVPFFFLLFLVEGLLNLLSAHASEAAHYSAVDTWWSTVSGCSQLLVALCLKQYLFGAALYTALWERFHLVELDDSWATYALCFVAGDFVYYWFHRHAHQSALLWAGHSVHHSSERYNLSVAVRQSWFQSLVGSLWSLPVVLLLPPRPYVMAQQWVTLYQFWIHTCLIRQMPAWFEFVFSTPSHHRVHHDRRLHKNFAGVFIIWDRVFGTFHAEVEGAVIADAADLPAAEQRRQAAIVRGDAEGDEITYFGFTDTVWNNAEAAMQLQLKVKPLRPAACGKLLRDGRPVAAAVQLARQLLVGPGFTTATARRPIPMFPPASMPRFRFDDATRPWAVRLVVLGTFVVSVAYMFLILINARTLSTSATAAATLFCLASWGCQGALWDGIAAAPWLEMGRCVLAILLSTRLTPFVYVAEIHVATLTVVILTRHFLVR